MVLSGTIHSPASEIGVHVVLWASPVSTMCETQQDSPPSYTCNCAKRLTLQVSICTPAHPPTCSELLRASTGAIRCESPVEPHQCQTSKLEAEQEARNIWIYMHTRSLPLLVDNVEAMTLGNWNTPGTFAPTCMHEGWQKSQWFELQYRNTVESTM